MNTALPQTSTTESVTSPVEVTMPQLGETVAEGTVTRWLKGIDDSVEAEEPLLEVATDKVDTEIVAPATGVLAEIAVAEGETVPAGAVLALIDAATRGGEHGPDRSAAVGNGAPEADGPADTAVRTSTSPAENGSRTGRRHVHSPLVRRLAAEHAVDLTTVEGTGVGGRITRDDVLLAARKDHTPEPVVQQPSSAVESAPGTVSPASEKDRSEAMSPLRKVIAERMLASLRTSAQLTTVVEADVTAVTAARDRMKREFEERERITLTVLPFFARAALNALREVPTVNASLSQDGQRVTYHHSEHLGIAVDTERGLLVPVIRDAGHLTVRGLAHRIADLAARCRGNNISPDELSGGTFTVTNTGSRGSLFDTPIINQPEVAILGTGSVVRRPVVLHDTHGEEVLAIRSMMYLALTYDHRLVDGADAARFLSVVKQRLENNSFPRRSRRDR